MKFIASAVTDIGNVKKTNQDSVCVKIADYEKHGQVAMAVICDGMGGLDKGELASATVIRAFAYWFENSLPKMIVKYSWKELSSEWEKMIKEQNYRIDQYGKQIDVSLGTTVTAMLIIDGKYLVAHVGDSRVYEIRNSMSQLTEDQTFVAREIKRGNMTPEQASRDPRRNMLLQCVGASRTVAPQMLTGNVKDNTVFMFCSDGFRHVISEQEIFNGFNPDALTGIDVMERNCKRMIDLVKSRKERDNITVALLKCNS